MSALLNELQKLETELHQPNTRSNAPRLEQLLHPDFREVGRSGCAYDRDTVIAHLQQQSDELVIESWDFKASAMGSHAALLTYRSAQRQQDGGLIHHAHRSSIWLNGPQGWQVFYHQGTQYADHKRLGGTKLDE